jgi:hypothetical protein
MYTRMVPEIGARDDFKCALLALAEECSICEKPRMPYAHVRFGTVQRSPVCRDCLVMVKEGYKLAGVPMTTDRDLWEFMAYRPRYATRAR